MKSELLSMLGREPNLKYFSRMFHVGLSLLSGFCLGVTALLMEEKALHLHRLTYLISPGSEILNLMDGFELPLDIGLAINTCFYAFLIYETSSALLRMWNREAKQKPQTRQG